MSTAPEEHNKNQTVSETSTEAPAQQKKLEGEELLDAIRKQVEYYFSRQNLANDPFLVQHMNNQLYVPIDFIANFKLVKNLTQDVAQLREAIRKSTSVVLDETESRIKPNFNLPRNTVILRDIPSNTNIEEVRAIFSDDNMPTRIQSQIGDNWFVVFETDDQALLALDQIRGKMVGEYAVQARIKTENILKAFTHGQPSQTPTFQPNPYAQPHQPRYPPRNQAPYDGQQQQQHYYDPSAQRGGGSHRGGRGGHKGAPREPRGQGQRQPRREDNSPTQPLTTDTTQTSTQHMKSHPSTSRPASSSSSSTQPPSTQPDAAQDRRNQPRSKRTSNAHDNKYEDHTQHPHNTKRRTSFNRGHPAPSLGVKNFPPLPTISKADLMKSGYDNDKYISYPKGAIISVYNTNLKNNTLTRPDDLIDCAAVLKEPKQQLELTKPPLPHHEVQQHPEHVEQVDHAEHVDQQESTATEQTAQVDQQTLSPQTTTQEEATQQQAVIKSFAEAAINAKDIRITKEPRIISAGDSSSNDQQQQQPQSHQKKRRNSVNKGDKKQQQQQQQGGKTDAAAAATGASSKGKRRGSIDKTKKPKKESAPKDASAPVDAKEQGAEGTATDAAPRSSRNRRNKKSGEKKEGKPESAAKKEEKVVAPVVVVPVDPKSYAAIVNRNKEGASPKPSSPQGSPRSVVAPSTTAATSTPSSVNAESPTGTKKK